MQEFQTSSLAGEMIGMSGSIVHGLPIQGTVDALCYSLKNCSQLHQMSDKDLENWLFAELYHLYEILKGKRPGDSIAGPFYHFTIQAAELVGVRVTVTPDAFRMRIKRLGDRRRNEPEIPVGVARLLRNVPPPPDPVLLCSVTDVVLAWKPSFCAQSKFRPYSRGS